MDMGIEAVQEGMMVVDRSSERVGKVNLVQMGDPEAVTTEGNELPAPGLIGQIGMALVGDQREPDVPEPERSRLLRTGFIKVDGAGLFDHDRYVPSDQIGSVTDKTVTLTVLRRELIRED